MLGRQGIVLPPITGNEKVLKSRVFQSPSSGTGVSDQLNRAQNSEDLYEVVVSVLS